MSKSNQRAIVTRVKRLSGIVEKLSDSASIEKAAKRIEKASKLIAFRI